MNGEHSVWFNALKEQTISTKEFAEIEDVIIYELCQKKVSYHNAKTILKFVSDRLEYHQFNTMIDKNPKDTLISELKSGRHNSKTMVEDFKKYGREHFEVYILEENIPYKERFKEYEYMRTYNSFDEEYGYNRGDRKKKNKKIINYIHSMPPNVYANSIKNVTSKEEEET